MSDSSPTAVQRTRIWESSPKQGPLLQGEILSGVKRSFLLEPYSDDLDDVVHGYVVVLTQDCDLTQDYDLRASLALDKQNAIAIADEGERKVALQRLEDDERDLQKHILFCEVAVAESVQAFHIGETWNKVKQNEVTRFHYLCESLSDEDVLGAGLPALLMDFTCYFTIPTEEVYYKLDHPAEFQMYRRSHLVSPYMEHLASRFSGSISRIALPTPHWALTAMEDTKQLTQLAREIRNATPIQKVIDQIESSDS